MFFCDLAICRRSLCFFLMIRRPPRSTLDRSSAASDVYKRQRVDDARVAGARSVEGVFLRLPGRVLLLVVLERRPACAAGERHAGEARHPSRGSPHSHARLVSPSALSWQPFSASCGAGAWWRALRGARRRPDLCADPRHACSESSRERRSGGYDSVSPMRSSATRTICASTLARS